MASRNWWEDPPDIVPLNAAHDRESFTCGVTAMDDFLRTAPLGESPLGTVWVATPSVGSSEILAYYYAAPDPVELVDEVGSVVHGVVTTLRVERIAVAVRRRARAWGLT
jgi:hypothetical protein